MTDPEQLLDKTFGLADLPVLRAIFRDCAIAVGLTDERPEEFVLAAHELLANAIEHGGGSGQVRIFRTRAELRCQVSDHGPGLTAASRDGTGLRIVRALADQLNIKGTPAGTDITMAMNIPLAAHPLDLG